MKKALILHGTSANHSSNWFPWLKQKLEGLDYEVWVPDLPNANKPNIQTYNEYLLNNGWNFSDNLVIGHSSGAVEALALLQVLPESVTVDTVVLVGVFKGDLGWESLKGVNASFDYPAIKKRAKRFIVLHSDNDPYCPLAGAKEIANYLDAEFKLLPNMTHFSYDLDNRFNKFPELLEIIA